METIQDVLNNIREIRWSVWLLAFTIGVSQITQATQKAPHLGGGAFFGCFSVPGCRPRP